MKVPPTQEEIDAANASWNEHASNHTTRKFNRQRVPAFIWIVIIVLAVLFLPTERDSYDSAVAWVQKTTNHLIYRVPCMAPESSFVGKWIRGRNIDCASLWR